jgi:hypothetical protein
MFRNAQRSKTGFTAGVMIVAAMAVAACASEVHSPLSPSSTLSVSSARSSITAAPVVTTLFSTTAWTQSTVVTDGGPTGNEQYSGTPTLIWGGVASLPATSTYTLPVGALSAASAAGSGHYTIPGSTIDSAGTGVHYFRTTVTLPTFATIAADLRIAVNNGAQIFINGHEIGRMNAFTMGNFFCASSLSISTTGAATTGTGFVDWAGDWHCLTDRPFDSFPATFAPANWISGGDNEIVIAVWNPSVDAEWGAFSFSLAATTTAPIVPTVPVLKNAEQCEGTGWKNYTRADGTTFKNRGACQSYGETLKHKAHKDDDDKDDK